MQDTIFGSFQDLVPVALPPIVISLVDCALGALERLERIADVGTGFYPACLRALEVSLPGSCSMPGHSRFDALDIVATSVLHMLLAHASPWLPLSGIIITRLSL